MRQSECYIASEINRDSVLRVTSDRTLCIDLEMQNNSYLQKECSFSDCELLATIANGVQVIRVEQNRMASAFYCFAVSSNYLHASELHRFFGSLIVVSRLLLHLSMTTPTNCVNYFF